MADINVERKQRSVAPLLLALVLVAAIAVAAWWFLGSQDRDAEAPPASEVEYAPDATTQPQPGNPGGTMEPAAPPVTTTPQDTTAY